MFSTSDSAEATLQTYQKQRNQHQLSAQFMESSQKYIMHSEEHQLSTFQEEEEEEKFKHKFFHIFKLVQLDHPFRMSPQSYYM